MRRASSDEAAANLARCIKFAARKSPSASDGIAWSTVCWSLRLEQDQDSLGTVRRPRCDNAAISFAQ